MKIVEAALFRLAMQGKLTLEQAKVLNIMHKNRACTIEALEFGTGLCASDVKIAVAELKYKNLITEILGSYFCPDFLEKIAGLIDSGVKAENENKILVGAR
ncbi:MAG TPA: hypothetical protein VJG83_02895 [archaeon]|nr:hypothetical protein [archaeon]